MPAARARRTRHAAAPGAMAARGRSRQAASNNNLDNNARLPQAGD